MSYTAHKANIQHLLYDNEYQSMVTDDDDYELLQVWIAAQF